MGHGLENAMRGPLAMTDKNQAKQKQHGKKHAAQVRVHTRCRSLGYLQARGGGFLGMLLGLGRQHKIVLDCNLWEMHAAHAREGMGNFTFSACVWELGRPSVF